MTPNDIWKKGIPLSQAVYRSGRKDLITKLRNLETKTSISGVMMSITDNIANGSSGGDAIVDGLQSAHSPLSETLKIRSEIQEWIIDGIRSRKILAYGFSYPRQANDQAQEVPDEFWDIKDRWASDTLKANGLQMDAIHLTPIKRIQRIPANPHETQAPGRPSRQEQIICAFEVLNKQGKINRTKSMRSHFPAIREWVIEHFPEQNEPEKGLSDKTLARVTSPLFK